MENRKYRIDELTREQKFFGCGTRIRHASSFFLPFSHFHLYYFSICASFTCLTLKHFLCFAIIGIRFAFFPCVGIADAYRTSIFFLLTFLLPLCLKNKKKKVSLLSLFLDLALALYRHTFLPVNFAILFSCSCNLNIPRTNFAERFFSLLSLLFAIYTSTPCMY